MTMPDRTPKYLLFLVLAVCIALAGCSIGKKPSAPEGLQTYIDANLRFSISYPESWADFLSTTGYGPYGPYSVDWNVQKEGLNNDISMMVISIPLHEVVPGIKAETILLDLHPNLIITGNEAESLPAGEASRLSGYTPDKTLQAWALDNSRRHYILVFTAPPDYFATQMTLFNSIAHSFEPHND